MQIFWRDHVRLHSQQGTSERVHARRSYYGKPRYDLLQLTGEDGTAWYARALAFFDVQETGRGWRRMALVHWLQPTHVTHVPGTVTYRYWAMRPDVVKVSSIVRSVRMITSPRRHAGTDEVCFVSLPYGKWRMV